MEWGRLVVRVLLVAVVCVVLLGESKKKATSDAQCAALAAAAAELPRRLVAIGDLHGDLDALREILAEAGLADEGCEWRGEDAVLVQLGDVVDRGPSAEEVNECLRALQATAPAGSVVRLTGNHELMWAEGDFRFASRTETEAVRRRSVKRWKEEVGSGAVSGAFAVGPFLFSHAGFRPRMLDTLAVPQTAASLASFVDRELRDAVATCDGRCRFDGPLFSAGPDRGGRGLGGAFWTDFSVLASAQTLPPGLIQVVGHTAAYCNAAASSGCEPLRFRQDLAAICVDAGLSVAYASNRAYLHGRRDNDTFSLHLRTLGPGGRWRDQDLTAQFCSTPAAAALKDDPPPL